jgi:hypothetical protein
MRKILALLLVFMIPVVYYVIYVNKIDIPSVAPQTQDENLPLVHIGDVPLRVEVADTPTLWEKGLGGRTELGPNRGMLFIFDKSAYHPIWMHDMRIVIDVIWIDEHFKVVDIKKALRPDTYPQRFEPKAPARFAIETNANYAESFGIKIGDIVTIPVALVPEDLRIP